MRLRELTTFSHKLFKQEVKMPGDLITADFPPRPEFTLVQSAEKTTFLNSAGKEEMSIPRPPISLCPLAEELNYNLGCALNHIWRHAKSGADDVDDLRAAIQSIEREIKRVRVP
jgi:hypothetical protein